MSRARAIDLAVYRFRLRRRLAFLPFMRIAACAFLFAGGMAAMVSGLLILDSWLKSFLDFLLAIFFLGVGLALWNLE